MTREPTTDTAPDNYFATEWTRGPRYGTVRAMTLAQLLQTLRPAERDAVHAVYVERMPLADAATHLSVDQTDLARAISSAFRAVARWLDDPEDVARSS